MWNPIKRGLFLGLLATASGLMLQCLSDPNLTEDGGVLIDSFLADLGIKDDLPSTQSTPSVADLGAKKDFKSTPLIPSSNTSKKPKANARRDSSIGPKAYASTDASIGSDANTNTSTGLTKKVLSGIFKPENCRTYTCREIICDPTFDENNPPAVTFWIKNKRPDSFGTIWKNASAYVIGDAKGCYRLLGYINSASYDKGQPWRLVLIN